MRPKPCTILTVATLALAATRAAASDYLWVGPANGYSTANWNTAANWSRYAGTSGTYPNAAGDHLEIVYSGPAYGDSVFGIPLPTTFTQATFGSCTVSNYLSNYYSESAYISLGVPSYFQQALRVLNLNNGMDPVVLQAHVGTLHFGAAYPDNNGGSRLEVRLVSEKLIITNGVPSSTRAAVVYLGGGQYYQRCTTLSGGTAQAPRQVIIQAGHQNSDFTCRVAGTNTTFIGTWTVVGSRTALNFARDEALGVHPLNTVTLRDGGKLVLNSHATRADPSWTIENRTVQGVGTVSLGIGKPLAVGTDGVLVPGENNAIGTLSLNASNVVLQAGSRLDIEVAGTDLHDVLAVATKEGEPLTLGGTLSVGALDGYEPAANQTWTIVTASGAIEGAFASVTSGYEASVTGQTVVLRRLPPPGTMLLLR